MYFKTFSVIVITIIKIGSIQTFITKFNPPDTTNVTIWTSRSVHGSYFCQFKTRVKDINVSRIRWAEPVRGFRATRVVGIVAK
jgi:hypothetical protein